MPQILGFAVIGADGTELHLSGVTKTEHVSTGLYRITFDSSVYNACEIASIASWQTAGCITAYGVPPYGPDVVEVMTFTPNGTAEDQTFQLLVIVPDVNVTTGTVPDVVGVNPPVTGLPPGAASNAIERAGFVYSQSDDAGPGATRIYAEDQNPSGGTVAPLGTIVSVTIHIPAKGNP
jgi:hypothetical protein